MKKDRFVAFFDAIMAIIMTIVVLEFAVPDGTGWSHLKQLSSQVLVYALSFFWLGMMWINIHTIWSRVESIDRSVMWVNLIMLFFSSMIPFLVLYVSSNMTSRIPQLLYGIDVICITICNQVSAEVLKGMNPAITPMVLSLRKGIALDLCIKVIGIVLGMLLYPPLVIASVFVAMICLVAEFSVANKKHIQKADSIQTEGQEDD